MSMFVEGRIVSFNEEFEALLAAKGILQCRELGDDQSLFLCGAHRCCGGGFFLALTLAQSKECGVPYEGTQ